MSMVDSRSIGSAPEPARRIVKARLYAYAVVTVFVAAVIAMTLEDGIGGAIVTVLIALALAGTALGVWGTAMAVRETENLRSRIGD
jgi:hypothetical protein